MPRRWAVDTTVVGPTSITSCAETEFNERASASAKRDLAEIFAVEVPGRPVADANWRIVAHGFRCESLLQRRQIDERLERRARLTLGLAGTIELAVGIVIAANQRPHRTRTVHRNQRALRNIQFLAVLADQIADRCLAELLQAEIDSGIDDHIATHIADQIRQFLHHPVGHILLRTAPIGGGAGCRLFHGEVQFLVADHALFAHGRKDKL